MMAEDELIDALFAALKGLLAEPYGCPFCDSGKLRKPDNPAKDHTDGCPYRVARALVDRPHGLPVPERYFEDVDNSSHHYYVPVSRLDEWQRWRDLPDDDPEGWDAPEWAVRIDGGTLTFADPRIEEL